MRRKRNNFIFITTLFLAICLFFSGCKGKASSKDVFYIYDANREFTRLVANQYEFSKNYSASTRASSNYVGEALNRMITGPSAPDEVGAIGMDIGEVTYRIDGNIVNVNFDKSYYDADLTRRTLRRAAIVRTLCQIEGIKGVSITVDNEAVTDSDGQPIGVLTADSYLENDGAKINAYEKTQLHLYFTDAHGEGLVEVVKPVVYSSNISLEKLVVDNLIEGPGTELALKGICPTINPSAKELNVTVKDGICYVNMSADFLTKTTSVSDEVVVYSIVNSLTNLSNENKVQLMIDGETEVSFGGMYLSAPFESNYELVTTK